MLAIVALVSAFAAVPAFAGCAEMLPAANEGREAARGITASDLIELRDFGNVLGAPTNGPSPLAVSPDGKSIALLLTRADVATNSHCRALVVVPTKGGAPRIVDRGGDYMVYSDVVRGLFAPTGGPDMVVPAWSPDGKWIAYRKRVDGKTQVWRVRVDGTEAQAVTRLSTDVIRFAWVADDRMVIATRQGIAAAEAAVDAEALSGYLYDDRVVTMMALRPTLRAADVPQTALSIELASGAERAATTAESALLPPDHYEFDPSKITLTSATGWRAGTEKVSTNPMAQSRIWVADPVGRRFACAADACEGGLDQMWWTDDGALVFRRREGWARGTMAIYRWTPGQSDPRRIASGPEWLLGCTYRAARLYCSSESAALPRRVVAIDVATGKAATLFDPNPGFSRLTLGAVERIPTRNQIGLDSWSDLVLPPNYKPGRKLPLVIVQYRSEGFLRGGIGDDYPIFLLAQRGFAVLSVQRPPVFGSNRPDLDTWDKLITELTRDWNERKSILSSLLKAVDKVEARGIVDPKRVGITGLSDGLSTIEYGLINTRRFAAAAISTCCEDPKTVMTYGGTAWADWNRSVRHYPLASEDGTAFWKAMSFSVNARTLDTPILMQLADREYLGGLEAFTALREQKNPVELYVFPDEYHVKWQPRHRAAIYDRGIEWFAFWLNGERNADPAKASQYLRWEAMRATRPLVRSTRPPSASP